MDPTEQQLLGLAQMGGMALVLQAVMFAMHVWCVIKVARTSGWMATAVFFIPLVNYFALVRYWKDDDSDIKIPMAVLHIAWALLLVAMWSAQDRLASAVDAMESRSVQVDAGPMRAESIGTPSASSDGAEPVDTGAYTALLSELTSQTGPVALPEINAMLAVPTHFKFVSRAGLNTVASQFDLGVGDDTLGWLVHEKIKLGEPGAWYVELRWDGDGFVREESFANKTADEFKVEAQRMAVKLSRRNAEEGFPQFSMMGHPHPPQWIADDHVATWVEELAWEGSAARTYDCYALKQGRFGLVEASIVNQPDGRQELCLRAVRQSARAISFAPSHAVTSRDAKRDKNSPFVLADYVSGRVGIPEG
jgi:uncharacterized membrane-anchored protein